MADPRFHVVLHEPEIPNNTGAIEAPASPPAALHLIRPLAFDTDVKALRRAGLDYWPRLAPSEHESWDAYLEATGVREDRLWLYTTKTERPHWEATFRMGDHLVFGKETAGLPDSILDRYADRLVTLPMVPTERSLNLANAACAAVYEGLRQLACR